jgi:hypothetical protein
MKILTTSATLALLISPQSQAASMEDKLTPFAISSVNKVFPDGLPKCTSEDLKSLEAQLNVQIPTELAVFYQKFAQVRFTCYEILSPQSIFHNHLTEGTVTIITEAWKRGVPREYLPFCYDNADYYCIHLETGQVRFWSHDSETFSDNPNDMWASFNEWILKDWIPLMRE